MSAPISAQTMDPQQNAFESREEPVRGLDKMVLILFLVGLGLFGLISMGDLLLTLLR